MKDFNKIKKPPLMSARLPPPQNGARTRFIIDPNMNNDHAYKDRANQLFKIIIKEASSDQVQRLFKHFKLEEDSKLDLDFFGLQPISDNEPFRKRFETEVVRELYLRKYKCKRSQKKIERYRKEIERINIDNNDIIKLNVSIDGATKRDISQIDIASSKLDIGVLGGVMSQSKCEEIRKSYGQNSLYYTISHSDSQQIQTSQKYQIPVVRDFSTEENFSDQIKPEWKELFTLNLSGSETECIIFEFIRYNSTEGDLQIDHFELRPKEDTLFFELLVDQSPHSLSFQSAGESIYKLQARWRHQESLLKKGRDRKKIAQISGLIEVEKKILDQRNQAYAQLMDQEKISPEIILQMLGVTQILHDSNKIFSDEEGCNAPNQTTQKLSVSHQLAQLQAKEAPALFKKQKIIVVSNKESLVEQTQQLSQRKIITKAKTPLAFSYILQQDIQVSTPQRESQIFKEKRKSLQYQYFDEKQKSFKQYQAFLSSHQLSAE